MSSRCCCCITLLLMQRATRAAGSRGRRARLAQQASLQRQHGKPHTDRRLQSLVAPDRFPLAVRAAYRRGALP
jgi:hypothetical protein